MILRFKPIEGAYDVLTMATCAALGEDQLSRDVSRTFADCPSVREIRTHHGAISREDWEAQKGLQPRG